MYVVKMAFSRDRSKHAIYRSLVSDLKLHNKPAMMYNAVFMVRRLILVVTLTCVQKVSPLWTI